MHETADPPPPSLSPETKLCPTAVDKYLMGKTMTAMTLQQLVAKGGDMRVIPTVARKVLDLINREDSSAKVLADAISRDQSLAAHILKVANSALYGLSREITTLPMAVSVLGYKNIRDQTIVATTRGVYKRFGITEKMLWSHAVSSAIGAKLIAKRYCPAVADDAFICGLLHDVGKVILDNECPELFSEVMMLTYNEGSSSVQAETQVFGYTHTQVGALVTQKWNYPKTITETIAHHHRDEEEQPPLEDSQTQKILACVDLSNSVCKIVGVGYREPRPEISLEGRPSSQLLNLPSDLVPALISDLQEAFERESAGWT